ncbi:MAG: acyl-CoA/acyl-ACP dehydrogenase [Gammaproteobacteria bacterium]|nr:acyl-CoA/acyl-ACP dehydrogenase [Gammaproteobacteria bacterium]
MSEPFVIDEFQESVLDTVRRFNAEVVAPVAAELDARQNPDDCFSWDIIEKADDFGIRTMTLSEDWGGIGADSLTTALVIEELGKADMGISVVMAQTLKIAQILQLALTEAQQEKFIPMFRDTSRGLLAIGITEPETASNYFVQHDAPFQTKAEKIDGGWELNGMKHFISNGNRANVYLLFAQTEKGKSLAEGSTCFLLDRSLAGFTIGRVHDKMGERLANNAELHFHDCFVSDENVVGEVGRGFQVLVDFFPASNAYAAATVIGTATAVYERTVEWAKSRVQGGKPLIEHDGVRAQIAEMHMLLDIARTYVRKATWMADNRDKGWDPALAAFPKVFASQAAWKIATWASEIHGGYGFMRELGLEKLVRDTAAFLHSDGVNRTLLLKAAKMIF